MAFVQFIPVCHLVNSGKYEPIKISNPIKNAMYPCFCKPEFLKKPINTITQLIAITVIPNTRVIGIETPPYSNNIIRLCHNKWLVFDEK